MPFCMNCGKQLPDDAKFCSWCGMPTNNDNTKRKTVYGGDMHNEKRYQFCVNSKKNDSK